MPAIGLSHTDRNICIIASAVEVTNGTIKKYSTISICPGKFPSAIQYPFHHASDRENDPSPVTDTVIKALIQIVR